ncbi:hypothetical protein CANCADRAFT_71762 [Tortispora caseinolytica NRRL Y-17796]|uniref:Mediator of RNA polymerase II transcription subunit 14 n=1 Tax=Tortispora caseinolytica NRRL Y-17796 TaxID=767744 RepID=A0A1E4TIE3_9ASCO|nr:hypothetical protein CANCADRAFT_71762 [Tortispora caseinolytica NRRL Y-17796]
MTAEAADPIVLKNGQGPKIPHVSENFVSFSLITSRVIDNFYTELSQLILTLPSLPDQAKKRRILDFLVSCRQTFIKLLVLSKWSKSAPEVSRAIDVVSWLIGQRNCFINCVYALQELKVSLGPARLRNPDLQTALEVIMLGRTQLSTFDFIQADPLSPQSILDVLHELNMLIAFRLSLATDIPPKMRKYRIKNGRATFTVANEFEVDLGVVSDVENAPMFLIDFRFLFSPSRPLTDSSRMMIEHKSNEILSGPTEYPLTDLYNFLHSCIVDEQLQIYFQQGRVLEQGLWKHTLSMSFNTEEKILTFYYWKSNIAHSRYSITLSPASDEILEVVWKVDGTQKDHSIQLQKDVISTENLLKSIVALHSKQILADAYDILASSPQFLHSNDLKFNGTEIVAHITAHQVLKIIIQTVTGNVLFTPPLPGVHNIEQTINETNIHQPEAIAQGVTALTHQLLSESIMQTAKVTGWEIHRLNTSRIEDVRKALNTKSRTIFSLHQGTWLSAWTVLCVLNEHSVDWYVARLVNGEDGWFVIFHEPLDLKLASPVPSYGQFKMMALDASVSVSKSTFSWSLKARGIRFHDGPVPGVELGPHDQYFVLDVSSLLPTDWVKTALHVCLSPLKSGLIRVSAQGSFKGNEILKFLPNRSRHIEIEVETGKFKLETEFAPGGPAFEFVYEQVTHLNMIIKFLVIAKSFDLKPQNVSMEELSFSYADDLSASVIFSKGEQMSLSIPADNPQKPLEALFQGIFDTSKLKRTLACFGITASIFKLVAGFDKNYVYFIVRSPANFRLYYDAKNVENVTAFAIEIKIRKHEGKGSMIYFTDKIPDVSNIMRLEKLQEVWQLKEDGVVGLGEGVACTPAAATAILEKINDILMAECAPEAKTIQAAGSA